MTSEATPRPWSILRNRDHIAIEAPHAHTLGYTQIARINAARRGAHRGEKVGYHFYPEMVADAELIVRAVNAHDALVEIAETAIWKIHFLQDGGEMSVCTGSCAELRDALRLARGES